MPLLTKVGLLGICRCQVHIFQACGYTHACLYINTGCMSFSHVCIHICSGSQNGESLHSALLLDCIPPEKTPDQNPQNKATPQALLCADAPLP